MKHSKYIIKIYFLLTAWGMFSTNTSAIDWQNIPQKPQDIVERYCYAEFLGIEDIRKTVVKYSDAVKERIDESNPVLAKKIVFWDEDPLIVVGAYRVHPVTITGNQATALVSYTRLAVSVGEGLERELSADFNRNSIVQIFLMYDGIRWWIVDPPQPRSSLTALILYYETNFGNLEEKIKDPKLKEVHWYYQKHYTTLQFLKNLKKNLERNDYGKSGIDD